MFVLAMARPLLARVKVSTGIPGVKVVPNARDVLIDLYTQTLRDIKVLENHSCKRTESYRKNVQDMAEYRLEVCLAEHDWEAIERRLACGQLEDLVDQARDNLAFARKLVECKSWELEARFRAMPRSC